MGKSFISYVIWLAFGWIFAVMAAKSQVHMASLIFWGVFALWALSWLAVFMGMFRQDSFENS